MKTICRLSLVVFTALLTGCGGGAPSTPANPAAVGVSLPYEVAQDVMRVGDRITIRLSGVPDGGYIVDVPIPESGKITVALLTQEFQAAGITAAALASQITDAYINQKIYTSPIVTVVPAERYVNVSGDVRGPQRVLYTPDTTLLTAIISCGGFDEYANRRRVRIIRGSQVIYIDAVKAAATPGADPPLYPGDEVYVPRTPF